MRVSLPTMILSLAIMWMWLGWAAVGQGQCQGQGQDQGQCPGPLGMSDVPCNPDQCAPRWTFAGEAIALQRSTTRGQPLLVDGPGTTLLDSQNMNFPVAFGPKVSAICHNECGWDLEVAYFQVDGFSTAATVPGLNYMVIDVNPATTVVNDAQARYTSALYSGEVNVRRQWTDWLTLSAGYRMVELDERYSVEGAYASPLNISAINHLYGFQLGAEAEVYNMGGPLLISGLCKAGIYDNFANQSISQAASLTAQREQAAFLGEVGIVATYALTKRLAFRASYEAMWLTGVALAPEQLGATDFAQGTATVDTNGGAFYHGGGLGFEYRF